MGGRLKILLVVSLVLNVFCVGALAGAFVVRERLAEVAPPESARRGSVMRGVRSLAPADRAAFRKAMRSRAAVVEPLLRDARLARRQAIAEFAKPTFDQSAALAALTRARNAEAAARSEIEVGIVAFADGLSPQNRVALGQSLRHGGQMTGVGRRDGRRRDRDRPPESRPDEEQP